MQTPVMLSSKKLTDFLHLFVMAGFALALPLCILPGKYAGFFQAHAAGFSTLFILVLVVSFAIPVLLILIEAGAGFFFGERIRSFIHLVFLGISAALIVLLLLNRLSVLPGIVVFLLALLAGGGFFILCLRWTHMRTVLTALSPAILLIPVCFLFFSPITRTVSNRADFPFSDVKIRHRVPVVLIVFDEFNTMALLNKNGVADSVRYPNFAALAKNSWWFPNATCATLDPRQSISSILTGQNPSVGKPEPPTSAAHPGNLFTLLAGRYFFNVQEPETSLCPDTLRKYSKVVDFSAFTSDIMKLYGVLIVPGALKKSPAEFTGMRKITGNNDPRKGKDAPSGKFSRIGQVELFLKDIPGRKSNQLDFIHIGLPRLPYKFLSSGRSYNNAAYYPEGLISDRDGWSNSSELAALAYQRYLQQAGFTDRVLGRILDSLKRKGIYEKSLIIITASHGVSLMPNKSRLDFRKGNLREVFKVPTFVKLPHQEEPGICKDLISGTDILPTIAGVLGMKVPWKTDGRPVVPGNADRKVTGKEKEARIPGAPMFGLKEIDGFPLLGWKTGVFGSGTPLTELARKDSNQALLGKDVKDLNVSSVQASVTAEVENIDQFDNIDPGGNYLPALLRGHVTSPSRKGKLSLAIALNRKISATVSVMQWKDQKAFFSALLPEAGFLAGSNSVDIYEIGAGPDKTKIQLMKVPLTNREDVMIRSDKTGTFLVFKGGKEVPVKKQATGGFLDSFNHGEYTCYFTGWAFDIKEGEPASSVLIFSGNQLIAWIKPIKERKDLVPFLKTEKARYSGFRAEIPVYLITGEKIRAFGITRTGQASELKITDQAATAMGNIIPRKF
jgi:hypothetical protein